MQHDSEARYRLGATPFYATLTAGQQFANARVQFIRARTGRLADTAALFDAMGNTTPASATTPPSAARHGAR